MSSHQSPMASLANLGQRPRGSSIGSLTSQSPLDKEQLSQALDKIHTSAYQSESLTTFSEFASPPPPSNVESKGIAGDIMQNGLSGLYSRFRGAVVGGKEKANGAVASKSDVDSLDNQSVKSQNATLAAKAPNVVSREESGTIASPAPRSASSSRINSPMTSSFMGHSSESISTGTRSSKPSHPSTVATTTGTSTSPSVRPSITTMSKATPSTAIVPTLDLVNISAAPRGRTTYEVRSEQRLSSVGAGSNPSRQQEKSSKRESSIVDDHKVEDRRRQHSQSRSLGVDGNADNGKASTTVRGSSVSTDPVQKRPAAIERITQSHLPGYSGSRASSSDRSMADVTPINTSAHDSVRHEVISVDTGNGRNDALSKLRIPGTTYNEGAPEAVSARLEQMRKQVLSKEFWMADEICKECFSCGDTFSAFRRKHHCRTCGCIFDNKCTTIVSGQRFGVQGTLRVCKTCLDIINRRHDSSGSDDSGDEPMLPSFFQKQQAKYDAMSKKVEIVEPDDGIQKHTTEGANEPAHMRPLATPMMGIPTRRVGDSTDRRSAILEIDAPQLSRPSSSRSLKALSTPVRPPSSSHKRHLSKHNLFGRFKPTPDTRAPFHRVTTDDNSVSRLPAFHDDNIIDPDLAPYMSDEESSGDEQLSIFATMNKPDSISDLHDNDRTGFGSLVGNSKKHRSRNDKSISGISFSGRPGEDMHSSTNMAGFLRNNRRRNLSTASNILQLNRTSPRQATPGVSNLDEEMSQADTLSIKTSQPPSRMIRSASMRDARAPVVELNSASLHHVKRLLRQLLQDAAIPNVAAWEKALVPILLQCTDDVNPDVRAGDDIDIRHYVKLKKIPGGKPGDTSYVSGVVFTKNLALKSMPRTLANPRIVIVSFPIEYQRHHQHFMSLEPVIAQEKDFLRNMVNRIASLRPQVLLVQKHISGLALQYLAEAGIAVAYNVKQSVIEAVSRCAQTEIISSIDMVTLKPVHTGRSAGFDVKTYVHNDMPGKKKTYLYISGCPKDLGCTIALRGADMETLRKMKRITEFMVYVVYNLKLETCLMRDEFVLVPSIEEISGSLSLAKHQVSESMTSSMTDSIASQIQSQHDISQGSPEERQTDVEIGGLVKDAPDSAAGSGNSTTESGATEAASEEPGEEKKLISVHQSHTHETQEDQVPEDTPMPTFYSDMVTKHQTKILSASPFVKFSQPYLLMRAREQERKLVHLKKLRDQDTYEEQTETEKTRHQKFQLIKPEMVHEKLNKAPRAIMEVLHAVHDAEYDKALHIYQTQKRQWENYIQGNMNLFDPYAHQKITVLYTVVCTTTSIPCAGPELFALAFYNEHGEFDGDCTLGQYVEDLCMTAGTVCAANGCERKMAEHHRTYVHGEARVTIFVEKSPCKIKGLEDSILMWSYCKICQKETQVMPMSESTWKYSFGKYLELSFWSSDLRLRAGVCPHNLHRDHLRYFGFRNLAIRIHYDPIDLLEIVVPRMRITWKVDNDLRIKNEVFTKIEERWNRFMASVHSRIKGINIDSVAPEKAEACKAEVERLKKHAQDEHAALIKKLQQKYMESKYYEVVPLNRALRAMAEKAAEWDDAFTAFDADYFPSEKDIRRLAALQLKKMFLDRDESTSSLVSTEQSDVASDMDEKSPPTSLELTRRASTMTIDDAREALASVVEEISSPPNNMGAQQPILEETSTSISPLEQAIPQADHDRIEHLDLAVPSTDLSDLTPRASATCIDPFDPSIEAPSPSISPEPTLPLEATLSEKVERLRKAHRKSEDQSGVSESSIPRPTSRLTTRKSGTAVSPPLHRTQSQPSGALQRSNTITKLNFKQGESRPSLGSGTQSTDTVKSTISASDSVKASDKKLSERLGLGTLRSKKTGQSLIPRSINGKRKESKVSTLAKHFEQLSREFEKERMKDRRQRAAKVTQARAFPKVSAQPIVEVYKDVNEAVVERSPEDDLKSMESDGKKIEPASTISGLANVNIQHDTMKPRSDSPTDTTATADDTATEAETEDAQTASHAGSDDEGVTSDIDHILMDDILPGAADLAESLDKPETDISLELPKHEKTSLMKMLTNFWAERSASGWTPLEYPLGVGDHIFTDEDVIIREDEPSSLIAFALNCPHYRAALEEFRDQGRVKNQEVPGPAAIDGEGPTQADVETTLLRATGTHLAYVFLNGTARMQCKIFFAEQFDAVRRKCGVSDRIVESLSRCLKWDSKGGKTKAVFLKTLDDRFVLKQLSQVETAAFLKFAPAYFNIMAEALFHDLPSVIAKMLGFYQIIIKNPTTGVEIKWDILVMENLFYDRAPKLTFDLKGSMRNRKIEKTGEQNEVLLDENMVELIYESPLFAREHSKKLLRAAIFNDTLFLQRNDVMDYSLMVAVDEARKELVVGIIDVVRTYTWDKKLESWIKDRGFAGGGRNRPTVTSPKEYKSRFREAMNRYILQAPNSWHQWQSPENRMRDGKGGVTFAEKD